jgi:hypothetical protein
MWLTVLGYRKQLLITAEINTITVGLSSWKWKGNILWDNVNKPIVAYLWFH